MENKLIVSLSPHVQALQFHIPRRISSEAKRPETGDKGVFINIIIFKLKRRSEEHTSELQSRE